jgi:hypothetical protein
MSQTQTPSIELVTEDQLEKLKSTARDLARKRKIPAKTFQRFLGHKDLISCLTGLIDELGYDPTNKIEFWQRLYQKLFDLDVDFSELVLPDHKTGFDRLIVVAEGLTAQHVYDVMTKHFKCWKYADQSLDEAVPSHDRLTIKAYAIWVRDRIEADEELKNLSAQELAGLQTKTETLLERLLHEMAYWSETGKHLDIQNVTLCSGSRLSGGSVPGCYWCSGQSEVGWCNPSSRDDILRAREVVSA